MIFKTIEVYVIPAALAGYGITLFTTLRVQRVVIVRPGVSPDKTHVGTLTLASSSDYYGVRHDFTSCHRVGHASRDLGLARNG